MKKYLLFLFILIACNKQNIEQKNKENSLKNSNFIPMNTETLTETSAVNPNNVYIVTNGKNVELCYKDGDTYKIVQPEGDTSHAKIFVPTKILGYASFVGPVPVPTRPPSKP